MAINANLDGPPPSPATDPAAAQEAGSPASQVQSLVAGQMPNTASGPDLSGLMTLAGKIDEALLTLAQAAPLIAPDIEQMRALLENMMGRFVSQSGGGAGMSGQSPMAPAAAPPPVTQAGPQFPGAMSANSRPA